mmetsp:Transcript_13568/g.29851  ORF Transcript_13568/g.29851 Transcript_13568/m.29851 type:complete len:212 (-) Transcript_13568:40-675(-)
MATDLAVGAVHVPVFATNGRRWRGAVFRCNDQILVIDGKFGHLHLLAALLDFYLGGLDVPFDNGLVHGLQARSDRHVMRCAPYPCRKSLNLGRITGDGRWSYSGLLDDVLHVELGEVKVRLPDIQPISANLQEELLLVTESSVLVQRLLDAPCSLVLEVDLHGWNPTLQPCIVNFKARGGSTASTSAPWLCQGARVASCSAGCPHAWSNHR